MAHPYRVTQDGVIRRGACFLVAAHLQAAAGGAATLVLRDGIDTVAPVRVSLSAPVSDTEEYHGSRVPFYDGIYASITGSPDFAQIEIESI